MFRKTVSFAAALTLAASLFTGCSAPSARDGKLSVVCTIFPVYDWAREVIGDADGVQLTYLMNSGADLHNYQPTADDMIRISDCDVFIYVGGESDSWVDGALSNARNKDMIVIDLMDVLGNALREEELKEGMEAPDEEEEEEGIAYDEHIWLSLRNAEDCTAAIACLLSDADSEHAGTYKDNASSYIDELEALDADFTELTASAKNKTLIFADRFPFLYFVDDYGLDYYAAFIGCSAESEASFETIAFLADKVDELGVDCVFTIEGSSCTIADAVITAAKSQDIETVTLNSMQSVTQTDDETSSYYGFMQENYNALKEALN
ncbi:MAG: metal ABC transporter substrate-binding protein [Ruminococcus sp.]|nr:metal ABC transporter substrate-binding protein [Ruminococcus sp.]